MMDETPTPPINLQSLAEHEPEPVEPDTSAVEAWGDRLWDAMVRLAATWPEHDIPNEKLAHNVRACAEALQDEWERVMTKAYDEALANHGKHYTTTPAIADAPALLARAERAEAQRDELLLACEAALIEIQAQRVADGGMCGIDPQVDADLAEAIANARNNNESEGA